MPRRPITKRGSASRWCAAASLVRRAPGKPVVAVSSSTSATHPVAREILGDVPLLRGIKPGLVALRAAAGNRLPLPVTYARPARPSHRRHRPGAPRHPRRAARRCRPVRDGSRRPASVRHRDGRVHRRHHTRRRLEWAADRYPVVAKVASPDIAHRSDIGAVVTGIAGPDELVHAYEHIREAVAQHAPSAVVEGVEIQAAVPPDAKRSSESHRTRHWAAPCSSEPAGSSSNSSMTPEHPSCRSPPKRHAHWSRGRRSAR